MSVPAGSRVRDTRERYGWLAPLDLDHAPVTIAREAGIRRVAFSIDAADPSCAYVRSTDAKPADT